MSNTITIDTVTMEAHGDRLLIVEDAYRTGYECADCGGKGKRSCHECNGTGVSPVNAEITCKLCHGSLIVTCWSCKGQGALIHTPETSQRRPTTGTIVSIGVKVVSFKVGESVLFSNFAGYAMELGDKVVRILHEPEILAKITGHLTVRRAKGDVVEGQDSHDWINNKGHDSYTA